MAVEVVGLVDVGVGLGEVAEGSPELQFRRDHVAGVELDEHLRHLCHDISCCVDLSLVAACKLHAGLILLVGRFLVSE